MKKILHNICFSMIIEIEGCIENLQKFILLNLLLVARCTSFRNNFRIYYGSKKESEESRKKVSKKRC